MNLTDRYLVENSHHVAFQISKNKGIREVGNVIRGIASSIDQCIGQMKRRRKMKFEQRKVEGVGRNIGKRGVIYAVVESRENMCEKVAGDYSKRKMVSPAEGRKIVTAKSPTKEESTYAEMCGRLVDNEETDREKSENSESWSTVGRRRREWKEPQGLPSFGARANEGGKESK